MRNGDFASGSKLASTPSTNTKTKENFETKGLKSALVHKYKDTASKVQRHNLESTQDRRNIFPFTKEAEVSLLPDV